MGRLPGVWCPPQVLVSGGLNGMLKGPAGGWRLWGRSHDSLATQALLRRDHGLGLQEALGDATHRCAGDSMLGTCSQGHARVPNTSQAGRKQVPRGRLAEWVRVHPSGQTSCPAQRGHGHGTVPREP